MSLSKPLLPAPATTSMSSPFAALISSRSAWENSGPPQLFDNTRTFAPPVEANACLACAANANDAIASSIVPLPSASTNLRPISWAVQLTPATPVPLPPTAPIVPATCVPWWWSSIGSHVRVIALKPWLPAGHVIGLPPRLTVNADGADHMLAARSGWL